MLVFPCGAVEEVATVAVAADDAREAEAVALPPNEDAPDEESADAGSEEDVGVAASPTDDVTASDEEAPVTVLDADSEAVGEVRVSEAEDEDSAADERVDDADGETGAESDGAGADVD